MRVRYWLERVSYAGERCAVEVAAKARHAREIGPIAPLAEASYVTALPEDVFSLATVAGKHIAEGVERGHRRHRCNRSTEDRGFTKFGTASSGKLRYSIANQSGTKLQMHYCSCIFLE
jgi:hypothetical protein